MKFSVGSPEALRELLAQHWQRLLDSGFITYDPSRALSFRAGALAFHFVAGRAKRPRPHHDKPPGLRVPHSKCPFDDPEALRVREVSLYERSDRLYHVGVNRFPVKHLHHLIVRSPLAPEDTLPQCLFGPDEIEDMLLFATALGPGYRFYFNSNQGRDRSHSGSSINHWHFHFFPLSGGPLELTTDSDVPRSGVQVGSVPDWGVPHRVYRSCSPGLLARTVWRDLERVVALDVAFNFEFFVSESDCSGLSLALYVRRPLDPVPVADVGALSNLYGGIELSGHVILYEEEVYRWLSEHPRDAEALAWKRLRAGTRDFWT